MAEIVYQNKDVASKVMADTLKGKSLAAFGLPHLKIMDVLPTNLPAIESNELRLDNLFLLNDKSLAILDYESKFDKENFVKYINYIARVLRRYAVNRQLDKLNQIKMVVIYTADVESAESVYNLGGLTLNIESAYLIKLDTNGIYRRIKNRIESGEKLTEEELMELMVLPLTVKGRKEKQKIIIQAVELARILPEQRQRIDALAGILTFSDKVIDEAYKKKIKEEIQMTQVGQMLIEEGMELGRKEGLEQGLEQGLERGLERGREEGIRALIEDNLDFGISADKIVEKLMKKFKLDKRKAAAYVKKYSGK